MKRMIYSIGVLLLTLATGCDNVPRTVQADPEPDFAAVKNVVTAFRGSGEPELVLSVAADSFSILRSTSQPLSEAEALQKLKAAKEPHAQLRFAGANEVFAYEVDSRTSVEETRKISASNARRTKGIAGAEKGTWAIRNLTPVATYPRKAWAKFLEFALANGLSDLVVYGEKDELYGQMSFASGGPEMVPYGTQSLKLSGEFYQAMRVSPHYPPVSGGQGFAVLIHDPHADVPGRYDLMLGLESLFAANPGKMEFLVEGTFPQKQNVDYRLLQNRRISDGGLFVYANKTASLDEREALIVRMLEKYLIDTPMAFRLRHSQDLDIPAYAIDDNRFLKTLTEQLGSRREADDAVRAILDSVPETYKDMVTKLGVGALILEDADLTKARDSDFPAIMSERAESFQAIAAIGKELQKQQPQLASKTEVLQRRASAYRAEAVIYRDALSRNILMQEFIAAEARNALARLPVAFIGSFHTQGITDYLKAHGIGYIVLEPRPRMRSPKDDANQERFDRFLNNYDAYFASVSRLNKGLCGLTPELVDRYHKPFIARQQESIRSRAADAKSLPSAHVDVARLWKSTQSNGDLADAGIEYGGGGGHGTVPPGAFAYFEESGDKRRLVILDAQSDRWKAQDRYDLLARVRLVFPLSSPDITPLVAMTRGFYEDKNTGRNFYAAYQNESKRIYLVEAGFPAIAAAMMLPQNKSTKDWEMHWMLSELEKGDFHRNGNDVIPTNSDVHNQL